MHYGVNNVLDQYAFNSVNGGLDFNVFSYERESKSMKIHTQHTQQANRLLKLFCCNVMSQHNSH